MPHKYQQDSPSNIAFAIKVMVIVLLPLLACSSYYTLLRLDTASSLLYFSASIAFPMLLLGISGLASLLARNVRSGYLLWLSTLAILVPTLLLLFIWF